jgi:hypothetical protein
MINERRHVVMLQQFKEKVPYDTFMKNEIQNMYKTERDIKNRIQIYELFNKTCIQNLLNKLVSQYIYSRRSMNSIDIDKYFDRFIDKIRRNETIITNIKNISRVYYVIHKDILFNFNQNEMNFVDTILGHYR